MASMILMVLLVITGLGIAFYLSVNFLYVLITYLVINTAYTTGLKHISILDIFMVSSGFILRVYSGGILGEVPISHWLVIMIMLLALFLALAKRRDDIVLSKNGEALRKSSRDYNLEFINSCLSIFSGVIIVSYIMYTVSSEVTDRLGTEWLFVTTIFVIAGLMRYLQITFVEQNSGSPSEILLKDRFILFTVLGWIVSFYIIIYIL
jgi:4-hydroxybenzoate polyprenyltransferase